MIEADPSIIALQDNIGRSVAHELCLCTMEGSYELFLRVLQFRIECLECFDNDGFTASHMAGM
jgi:hypothetical protein